MRTRRRALDTVTATLMALSLTGCGRERSPEGGALSLVETLGGADTVGYARADEPRTFHFPEDHGPHPDFRTEWWYVTGNLASAGGREEVGFQLTIFRSALAPTPPAETSAWATNQAYMAHFAVTDVEGRAFHQAERFERGAAGLAGAAAEPFRVWVDGWSLASADTADAAGRTFPLRLRAATDSVSLDLSLERGKPRVLQGDDGLSRKGPEPGNASYYYSFTRMPAEGTVRLGDETFDVTGSAWLDREWSTSALSPGVVGWDWFALQMDDGWDLMVYRLRTADGGATPESEGMLVSPDGDATRLTWGADVTVEPTRTWTAPDGAVYPAGWRVRVPGRGWDVDVTPRMADQEWNQAFRYWEGAVGVTRHDGQGQAGWGYVELTGYAGARPRR